MLWVDESTIWTRKKYSITTYLKSTTMKPCSQIIMRSMWRSRLCETITNNFQLFMGNYKYRKTKSTNISRNITMNHCKSILTLQKSFNFYDKIVNSRIWGKESRHISKNALIVNKISMPFMLNTRKIQYMKSSKAPWDEVFMNFIIKLPKSKDSTNEEAYDAILVMIDRLTKYCHIILFKKTYNVEQLKYVVLNRFIRYQKISKGLTNDKDKLFTSNYWRTLLSMLKIKLKMSTTFHPQTNEQTKKMNQSLKQYLRHYINNAQFNWVKLLLMTQLTLNIKVSNTTKVTSFFANFERESNLFGKSRNQISTKATITKKNTIKAIQENILKMQRNSTTYQNKKRKMTPLLKEGNKVYLLTKNLKINKRKSKKLNHVKVESFFIKNVKGRINYELNFSIDVKIFFVFHIFVLKSTHSNTSIQITFRYKSQKNQEYEVERILKQRNQQYFVKWKEYSTTKNT